MSRKLLTLFFSAFLIVGIFLVNGKIAFGATVFSYDFSGTNNFGFNFEGNNDGGGFIHARGIKFTPSSSFSADEIALNIVTDASGANGNTVTITISEGSDLDVMDNLLATGFETLNWSTDKGLSTTLDEAGATIFTLDSTVSFVSGTTYYISVDTNGTFPPSFYLNDGSSITNTNSEIDVYRWKEDNTVVSTNTGEVSMWLYSSTPADTSTRIDTFTYATSTRIANVTGYWNTHASSTERLSFWQSSSMLGQESYEAVYATTTGAFSFSFEFLGLPTPYSGSTTTAPFVAPYTLHAEIDQVYSDFNPFSGEGTPPLNLAATSTVVSTLTYGLPDYTTSAGLQEYPEYECAITSITGCLKNAGIWLFYPSSDSVERFKSLSDTLAGKFPFAYVYGMNTLRTELFESTQTATTTISLNFKIIPGHATSSLTLLSASLLSNVPYANTVKTIIGFILWLMAAEYVYYRVIRSHDPNTPQ